MSPSPDVAPSNSKPAVAAPSTSAPPIASSAVSPASAPANTVASGGPSNAVLAASVISTVLPPTEVAARGVASSPAPVVKAAQLPPQTPAVAVPNSSDTRPPERELATTAIATVPASAGATKADPNAPVRYKDGVYSGWGSSRHGDIEAYVEIKNGHIKSTFISECLTQYSCSWIAKLPGWVVEAQSAETDYISGATQSSNAFYYAVVAALNKAR